MTYNYMTERAFTLTEKGQEAVADVVDFARRAFKVSGAVRSGKFFSAVTGVGDSWKIMACVDRAAELGYIREFPANRQVAWQEGVYVPGRRLMDE